MNIENEKNSATKHIIVEASYIPNGGFVLQSDIYNYYLVQSI